MKLELNDVKVLIAVAVATAAAIFFFVPDRVFQAKVQDINDEFDKIKENVLIKRSLEKTDRFPSWLKLDKLNVVGSVVGLPQSDEFSHPINSQLIVELYSK